MKVHIKFLFMLVINSALFYISYILSFLLNRVYAIDSSFNGQVTPSIYYLVAIKIFAFTLFMLFQSKHYDYIRAFLGIVAGNILAMMYLLYIGNTVDYYGLYGMNAAIDLILILVIILIFNLISRKSHTDEEIEDINKYMEMKKDFEVIDNKINEKKEELKFIDSMIEKKEKELSNSKDQLMVREERSYIPTNTIELQSINCPIRIEIVDKSKCIGAVYREKGEHWESKIIVDEDLVKSTIDEMKKREEELDSQTKRIEKKDQIIEKTIINLEQISKTIKERMQLLDEKEIYINKQLKILEEKENDYSECVHNQLYEILFNSPDIKENEVKLKDKSSEIIIDKSDLMEIRKLIEREVEEE